MTVFLNHDDWPSNGFTAASYAEEHVTMHQFMHETTAADPTSCGYLAPDFESVQKDDQDPAACEVPRVWIRIYP